MKVYKIELLVVDLDGIGSASVGIVLEQTRYPNHCIGPRVMNVETRDVDWDDSHPLNNVRTMHAEYRRLFSAQADDTSTEVCGSCGKDRAWHAEHRPRHVFSTK